jgi:hypothetical protein
MRGQISLAQLLGFLLGFAVLFAVLRLVHAENGEPILVWTMIGALTGRLLAVVLRGGVGHTTRWPHLIRREWNRFPYTASRSDERTGFMTWTCPSMISS